MSIGRAFTTIGTALAGTSLVLLILEARRQRALRGETPAQTTERDEQAVSTFRDIVRDVRRDDISHLLSHSGIAAADITLNTLNEVHPQIGQPLLSMFNTVRTINSFNSLLQNGPAGLLGAGLLGANLPQAGFPFSPPSSQTSAPIRPAPTTLQSQLDAINIVLTPEEEQRYVDSITNIIMEDPVEATTIINANGRSIEAKYLYDRSTYDNLNGICPQNRQPFLEMQPKPELQTEIRNFVNRMVKEYGERAARAQSSPNPTSTLSSSSSSSSRLTASTSLPSLSSMPRPRP